jgi:tetratricopeptide (TPR) repeat protein
MSTDQRVRMVTILVRLADLEFLSPHDLSGGLSTYEIVEVIRKQFGYLPGEVDVEINDGVATIQFEEASQQKQMEARRLLEKAAKRAKSGEFRKAQDIYEKVLELDPAMADARRELAMTLFELGDMSAAKDQLIDALRLKPDDAWSYVVLGNVYVKHDRDFATASRFFTRALELKPGDPYALNSLAAVSQELGDPEKALRCFDEAISSHPEFANAWVGKAMLLHAQDKPAQVVEVLDSMFSRAEVMDTRSQPIFAEGRNLYLGVQGELAEAQRSDAFKALETYKAEVAALSGYPVKVRTEEVPGQLSGVAQIAWKRGRDHHIVQVSDRLPAVDAQHVEAHELTHIRLEALARKDTRNRWFATTAASRELAIRSLAPDIKKLERKGYSDDSITRVVLDLVGGLCGSIFNTPLDMWIETLLQREMPALRHAQFVSLHRLAGEALAATTHSEVRKLTPPKVLRASTALNGATALFLDDFTHGATDFWRHYQRLDGANLSPRLFQLWKDRRDALEPGDEYDLVDAFADQ